MSQILISSPLKYYAQELNMNSVTDQLSSSEVVVDLDYQASNQTNLWKLQQLTVFSTVGLSKTQQHLNSVMQCGQTFAWDWQINKGLLRKPWAFSLNHLTICQSWLCMAAWIWVRGMSSSFKFLLDLIFFLPVQYPVFSSPQVKCF